jgi:hypothetical protein
VLPAAAVGSDEEAEEDRQRNERRATGVPRDSKPDAHRRLIACAAWMAAVEKQRRCRADTDRLIGAAAETAAAAGPAATATAATELLPALAAAMVRAADRIVCLLGLGQSSSVLLSAAKEAWSLEQQSRPVATGLRSRRLAGLLALLAGMGQIRGDLAVNRAERWDRGPVCSELPTPSLFGGRLECSVEQRRTQ